MTRAQQRLRARKLPYYARAAAALVRAAAWRRTLAVARRGAVALREGPVLRLGQPLDGLVLAEVACFDAYRLRDLDAEPALLVDVGAGIGELTLLAALRFPGCRVVACEPHPDRFALLAENVARNGCTNVELVRAAIGTAPRYSVAGAARHAASRFRPAPAADGAAVPGRTLASLTGGGPVDLLKVDCEGAEADVLESLGAAGLARVRRVTLEYHDPAAAERCTALLTAAGLAVERVPDDYDAGLGYLYAQPGKGSPPQTAA